MIAGGPELETEGIEPPLSMVDAERFYRSGVKQLRSADKADSGDDKLAVAIDRQRKGGD